MILVDANLLVYAKVSSMPQHAKAHAWLTQTLGGAGRVGLPWESLLAFARLTTNPRVFDRPLTGTDAWSQVEAWLQLPNVWTPMAGPRHASMMANLIAQTNASGSLIPDAHLAALAIDNGLELMSSDSDFAKFPGLKWRDPLRS